MSDAERQACINVLRSLATSRRDASLVDLMRDYNETEGNRIPYTKFGFKRLEDFLSNSGEFSVTSYGTVRVHQSENSSHIQKLVAEQKNTTKKKRTPQQHNQPARPTSAGSFGGRGSPAAIRPSLYSQQYTMQQSKLRSPVKTHSMPYRNNNGNQQQQQKSLYIGDPNYSQNTALRNKSSPPPLVEKPSYVVTISNGEALSRPDNVMAQRQASVDSNSSCNSKRGTNDSKGPLPPPQQHQKQQQTTQKSLPQPHQQQQQQNMPRAITKNASSNAPKTVQQNRDGNGDINGHIDLRQRLDQKRNETQQQNSTFEHRQTLNQKSNAPTASTSNVSDLLRQRLKLPKQEEFDTSEQSQQHQEQNQAQFQQRQSYAPTVQLQEQQLHPQAVPPVDSSSVATLNPPISCLQNRLKINVQTTPVSQPIKLAVTAVPTPSPVYSHQTQPQQHHPINNVNNNVSNNNVRSTLNHRLVRKVSEGVPKQVPIKSQPQPKQQYAVKEMQQQQHASNIKFSSPPVHSSHELNKFAPSFDFQTSPHQPPPADNIAALAIYCTNKNFAVPSYKIFKLKTNRLQCRLMVRQCSFD